MTKLNVSLVFQVKIATIKYFFTCSRNPSSENNSNVKVHGFAIELNNTKDFFSGDFNAKNTN